jgi:hypothetical protein
VKRTATSSLASWLVGALSLLLLILLPAAAQEPATPLRQEQASGQRIVCNVGYTLEVCRVETAVLRRTLATYPTTQLGSWTWILVRSEDWRAILTPRGLDPDCPIFTYYAKRQTFVEEALVASVPGRDEIFQAKWRMNREKLLYLAIGHELGHAFCNEKDEAKANKAAKILRGGNYPLCAVHPEAKTLAEN